MGEHLIPLIAGSAAATGPVLLVIWRTRLGRLVDRMRRQ